jgi:hypothetical protein
MSFSVQNIQTKNSVEETLYSIKKYNSGSTFNGEYPKTKVKRKSGRSRK